METIAEINSTHGTAIPDLVVPTLKVFQPLLEQNKDEIFSITPTEYSYASHPRQKLDVYLSPNHSSATPLLVFFYGGGLVRGDKRLNECKQLVYHNLGTFFAKRGFTTVIADYRRLNSPLGGEDAVYPSGSDDISLVFKWLQTSEHRGSGKMVAMGASAGGLHLLTFLLDPRYLAYRQALATGIDGLKLNGAVFLSAPTYMSEAKMTRADMVRTYYGGAEEQLARSPHGLLSEALRQNKSQQDFAVPKLLLTDAEFDPEDEITKPLEKFLALLKEVKWDGYEYKRLKGHNHLTPPWSLMSGDVEAEKWAEDLTQWMKTM